MIERLFNKTLLDQKVLWYGKVCQVKEKQHFVLLHSVQKLIRIIILTRF